MSTSSGAGQITMRTQETETLETVETLINQLSEPPQIVTDDANTVSHVVFTDNGIFDLYGNDWAWSSPTTNPPVFKSRTNTNAAGTARRQVGVFSDSNYFTQGSAGAGLSQINGAFIGAITFSSDDIANGPILFSNYAGTSGSAGYLVQLVPGGGAYLICQGFTGPQTINSIKSGINTLIFGCAGTGATTGFIKLNNGPVATGAVTYNKSTTAVTTVGRYNLGGTKAFNGKIDEAWFSTDTPSVQSINDLYVVSNAFQGSGYRFPDTSGTVLHLLGRDFDGTTWTTPQATLTTVGTVSYSTLSQYTVSTLTPGRYGIQPGGTSVLIPDVATNASFYRLLGPNVLDFAGDFSAAMLVKPMGGDISGTAIYASNGVSQGSPGWQLVNETGLTRFFGTTGSVTDSVATDDKLNLICWGRSGGNLVMKINDRKMVSGAGSITASGGESRLGMHWDYLIGLNGAIYEAWFSTSTPTDDLFSGILNNLISSSAASGDTDVSTAFRSLTTGLVGVTTGNNVPRNATAADIGLTAGASGQTALGSMFIGPAPTSASGVANTSFGNSTCQSLTSGANNTMVGYFAGRILSTGGKNTALGQGALAVVNATNDNTAVGSDALLSSVGSNNTAVGSSALTNSTTGSNNTAIGKSAGATGADHTLCTFIGFGATAASNRVYSTAIGANATVSRDNTIALGNSSVDSVLIGQKASIFSGAGNPNGSVTASPGDIYLNTSGGAGTTLYVKESGAATNTGWIGK